MWFRSKNQRCYPTYLYGFLGSTPRCCNPWINTSFPIFSTILYFNSIVPCLPGNGRIFENLSQKWRKLYTVNIDFNILSTLYIIFNVLKYCVLKLMSIMYVVIILVSGQLTLYTAILKTPSKSKLCRGTMMVVQCSECSDRHQLRLHVTKNV